jgi:hypothetical protein
MSWSHFGFIQVTYISGWDFLGILVCYLGDFIEIHSGEIETIDFFSKQNARARPEMAFCFLPALVGHVPDR